MKGIGSRQTGLFRPTAPLRREHPIRCGSDQKLEPRLFRAAKAASQGERVPVRIGRRRVAIVPAEDLLLLEAFENEEDLKDLRASRAEAERLGTIPWEQVKAMLGLDDNTQPFLREGEDEDGSSTRMADCESSFASASGCPVRVEASRRVVGILISEEMFALFRRLLDAEEDRLDSVAARDALRDVESVALEELANELGL